MKLVKISKLYFNEGNSNKVYEIELLELTASEYLVNFRYGKRGSRLKEGTKTPEVVSHNEAEKIFLAVEKEKLNKGYLPEKEHKTELSISERVFPDSKEGIILHRLQDAVNGTQSFNTPWKTSRVIWKAGCYNIKQAIPFIIKLVFKGDEMQTYASLWALNKLKSVEAKELFYHYSFSNKKEYIRNIAIEGFLTIAGENELLEMEEKLLQRVSAEIKYYWQIKDYEALYQELLKDYEKDKLTYLTVLYQLNKIRPVLTDYFLKFFTICKFQPPCFKQIRSVYKLAQARNDYPVVAVLSYRIEKEQGSFNASYYDGFDSVKTDYLLSIDVGGEEIAKQAFSKQTQTYFRKNALYFLKNTAKDGKNEYLKLAVNLLLQYTESDYSPEQEIPVSNYGIYDYDKEIYRYTLIDYPECSESVLLFTILFGHSPQVYLNNHSRFIKGKREAYSRSYYFTSQISEHEEDFLENTMESSEEEEEEFVLQESLNNDSDKGIVGTIKNFFKNILGGEKELRPENNLLSEHDDEPEDRDENITESFEVEPVENISDDEFEEPVLSAVWVRNELYPEYWDQYPQAYIQLLFKAKMTLIHQFALNNLSAHPQYHDLLQRLNKDDILDLLNSDFYIPNNFGQRIIENKENDFKEDREFIAKVLNSKSAISRSWAYENVQSNTKYYFESIEFTLLVLFNSVKDFKEEINILLHSTSFETERKKALIGKTIAELLILSDSKENNDIAEEVISRLNSLASTEYDCINWQILEQLFSSTLKANHILASSIIMKKYENKDIIDLPLSLIDSFLKYENKDIRSNGLLLLKKYSDTYLVNNINFILSHTESQYEEVVKEMVSRLVQLIRYSKTTANTALRYLVYVLMRKEKFSGAHAYINSFVTNELKSNWNEGLAPKDITKLIHSQYRKSQITGYEILLNYKKSDDFTLKQIISFGNHEILALRQWCWNYYKENISRIKTEKTKALNLLNSRWEDTRNYAFEFFRSEFNESDWDMDTLLSIIDSIRPDVENFGKELIKIYSGSNWDIKFLTRLSEHPSVQVQAFITGYLNQYVAGRPEIIGQLTNYFQTTLSQVNKARVAKNRIFKFLHQESIKDYETAKIVTPLLDFLSAQSTIQDRATCIDILTNIKSLYPHIDMNLEVKN
ncbi:WGR domain-containing protein [Apibacter sp. HY039]|uniref:WGR domain-containing protein n=1 Tax=Apibacter sp. HY039 TaxID=2501476 RepID=UPI000FEBC395|nr:WGR domain-containing protein [Apibacter sp. HY039]